MRPLLATALCLITIISAPAEEPLSRIGFGSCSNERRPQPVWDAINKLKPQLFILAGDNVYADSGRPDILKRSYDTFGAIPGFAKLRGSARILTTWDDHDYGSNDAGAEWEGKHAAKEAFMEFFETPDDSPLRQRGGVYDAAIIGPEGKRVQVILLDTRWFRGPLKQMDRAELRRVREETGTVVGPYLPDEESDSTMLGEDQWEWLIDQLQKPAELRLLVSSIQAVTVDHGWEKWGNLPRERRRLFETIRDHADGVIILSGDRHSADISMLPAGKDGGPGYPLYDITSSGLTQTGLADEPNRYRISGDDVFNRANFGWITIDWEQDDPPINLEIRDVNGHVVREASTTLGALRGTTR